MTRRLPPFAVLLGALGLLPFLGCGYAAASLLDADSQERALGALVAYAAVILSFLGAVHWGLAIEDETGLAERARLALGVVPALIGWVGLLAFMTGAPAIALAILVLGFIAVIAVEQRGAARGIVPRRYLALRWGLTAVVVLTLAAVLVTRMAGLHLQG